MSDETQGAITPRFLFTVDDREFALYDDGPASAAARATRLWGPTVAASMRSGGWFDHERNRIVGAPDETRIEYGKTYHGSTV